MKLWNSVLLLAPRKVMMYRTFLKLSSVTMIAQLASFIFLPFILRNVSPQEYAHYAMVISVASIVLPFITLRLDYEIAASNENENLIELVISLMVIFQLTYISLSCMILLAGEIFDFDLGKKTPLTLLLIWMVLTSQSIVVFFTGLALQNGQTRKLNLSSLIQNYSTGIFQVAYSYFWKSHISLVFSYFVGRLIGVLPIRFSWRGCKFNFSLFINLFHYLKKLKLVMLSGVLDGLLISLPILLNYYFLSAQITGLLSVSQLLLVAPMTLISGSLINTFFLEKKRFMDGKDFTNELDLTTLSFFRKLLILVFVIALAEVVFSYSGALGYLIGSGWNRSQLIFNLLIIPYSIQLLASPFVSRLVLTKDWPRYLYLQFMNLVIGIVAFLFAFIGTDSWVIRSTSFHVGRALFILPWLLFEYRKTLSRLRIKQ